MAEREGERETERRAAFMIHKEASGFRPGTRERDTTARVRRHQAFALASVRERDASACVRRDQAFALGPERESDASVCIRTTRFPPLAPVITVAETMTVTTYDDAGTNIKSAYHC